MGEDEESAWSLMTDRMRRRLVIRNKVVREFLAEMLGTFMLLLIGDGSVAQSVLTYGENGGFLSINIAWSMAVVMGVYLSAGVSGGHINPAVSLAFAVLGRLPWYKVLVYMLAQYIGAILASVCVYGVYYDALNNFDGGVRMVEGVNATAGIWATYPQEYLSTANGLGDQIVGTAILVSCVLAVTDSKNSGTPAGLAPVAVGLIVLAIGLSFGSNCGYAINPARDLGPRIFTAISGWGSAPFSFRNYNWFWVPVLGPHIGALLGAWMYLLLVGIHITDDEDGDDSGKTQYDLPIIQGKELRGETNRVYNHNNTEMNEMKQKM